MKLWRRMVIGVLVVVVGVPLFLGMMMYAIEWRQRHRAERLLAAVQDLRPGGTTEFKYMETVQPFESDSVGGEPTRGLVQVGSQPFWVWRAMSVVLPNQINRWLSIHTGLDTLFEVWPKFEDGKLQELFIAEFQGEGHPHGGTVRIHAGRMKCEFPCDPQRFNGYWVATREWDSNAYDKYVEIDDRATYEQRRRALEFRFECFTTFHWCEDGRRMLNP